MLGLVLLSTAAAKAIWLAPETRVGIFRVPGVLQSVIAIEIVAAIWFLRFANQRPTAARWSATVLFGAFAIYSLRAWWSGTDCQCFGVRSLSPKWSLMIDMAVILLVWTVCRSPVRVPELMIESSPIAAQSPSTSLFRTAFLTLIGGLAVTLGTVQVGGAMRSAGLGRGRSYAVLEPDKWLGRPYPLWSETVISEQVRDGVWMLVYYRRDCTHCQQIVPQLVEAAKSTQLRLALIELSGDGPMEIFSPNVMHGQMSTDKQWLVTPPVGVLIADGMVQHVVRGDELAKYF
ncbi:MAG: hypothetical protein U0795_27105 [Pirellulales bacterium]